MNTMHVNLVKSGMIVDDPVYSPRDGKLLLQHGTVITPRMLVALKFHGVQQLSVSEPGSYFISPSQSISKFLTDFFEEQIRLIAPDQLEGNINDRMAQVSQDVRDIMAMVVACQEIADSCVELKLVNNAKLFYPSLHTCTRAVLVAGAMGMSEEEIYNVAGASLLQNLGLCEMSYLLDIPQRDAQQEALWQEHCQYGYYFAKERGIKNEICELIQNHHERFDGSGFPRGLHGDEIPMGAKIINLCADYDNMIFAQKMQPYQAVEIFYACGDGLYDSRVIDAFIMNLPLYPLGSIVRLSNKEVGVVVNIRKNMGPRPVVRVCYNRCNKPYTDTKVVDLGLEPTMFIEQILY